MSTFKYTRQQRLNNEVNHWDYFNQFCNPSVRAWVINNIGLDRLKACKDTMYFSDIPCTPPWGHPLSNYWDGFKFTPIFEQIAKEVRKEGIDTCFGSLTDAVCIAKAQARLILAELNTNG